MNMTRYGHWALITGASRGVGAAFARHLARQGYHLILVARNGTLLRKIANEVEAADNVNTLVIEADLGKPEGVDSVIAQAASYEVGLLVSNAGTGKIRYLLDGNATEDAELTYMNALAHQRLAQHFGAAMVQRGRGGVVLVSSTASFQPVPLMATYSAAKSFVNHLGEALFHEWRPKGVDVTVIVLGPTETEGFHNLKTEQGVDLTAMPMGLMQPQAVVDIALQSLGRKPIVTAGLVNRLSAVIGKYLLGRQRSAQLWQRIMNDTLQKGRGSSAGGINE